LVSFLARMKRFLQAETRIDLGKILHSIALWPERPDFRNRGIAGLRRILVQRADQVGFEPAVRSGNFAFEMSTEFRAPIAKFASGENFPPKLLSVCRSPVSTSAWHERLRFFSHSDWTCRAKRASMLASLVAWQAWRRRRRAPRTVAGLWVVGALRMRRGCLIGGPPNGQITSCGPDEN